MDQKERLGVSYKGVHVDDMTKKENYEFRLLLARNLYASFDKKKKESYGIAGVLFWFTSELGQKYLDTEINKEDSDESRKV